MGKFHNTGRSRWKIHPVDGNVIAVDLPSMSVWRRYHRMRIQGSLVYDCLVVCPLDKKAQVILVWRHWWLHHSSHLVPMHRCGAEFPPWRLCAAFCICTYIWKKIAKWNNQWLYSWNHPLMYAKTWNKSMWSHIVSFSVCSVLLKLQQPTVMTQYKIVEIHTLTLKWSLLWMSFCTAYHGNISEAFIALLVVSKSL